MHFAFHNAENFLKPSKIGSSNMCSYSGSTLPSFTLPAKNATYDYLIFYGSHGDCRDGKPTMLNGLSLDSVRDLVKSFEKDNVFFKNIVLDCCMTASFIPEFFSVLPRSGEGNIICYWGIAGGLIASEIDKHAKLSDAVNAYIDLITNNGLEFGFGSKADEVFMPVVIYEHSSKSLYRKQYAKLRESFVANLTNNENDFSELPAMDDYLKSNNVSINEVTSTKLKSKIASSVTVPL